MRYVTTVLTEFDEQLFDECYGESLTTSSPHSQPLIELRNIHNMEISYDLIKSQWSSYEKFSNFLFFKITDSHHETDVGCFLGQYVKPSTEFSILAVFHAMYKTDNNATLSWISNYWEEFSTETSSETFSSIPKIRRSIPIKFLDKIRKINNIENIMQTLGIEQPWPEHVLLHSPVWADRYNQSTSNTGPSIQ